MGTGEKNLRFSICRKIDIEASYGTAISLINFRLLLVLVSLQRSSSGHRNDTKQVLLFGSLQPHGGYRQVND